jgi:hypothetical protein
MSGRRWLHGARSSASEKVKARCSLAPSEGRRGPRHSRLAGPARENRPAAVVAKRGRPASYAAHGGSRSARWKQAGSRAGPKGFLFLLVILFSFSIYYFIHLTN